MKKITTEIVDERFKNRSLKRISEFTKSKNKIIVQCLKCNHVWETFCYHLINYSHHTGCPKCAKVMKITNDEVDKRLEGRNIKRLTCVINTSLKLKFQCLKNECSYVWETTVSNINRTGCPKCAHNLKNTNEIIDEKLKYRYVKRLGDYINNITNIDFQCLNEECNYIWSARPSNIICKGTGCPNCTTGQNEKLIHRILLKNNILYEPHKLIKQINYKESRKILVDFYFKYINLIIEYNGEQHYKPVNFGNMPKQKAIEIFEKQKERDIYLENFCKNNNIELIWIDGRKYKDKKLEKYIMLFLHERNLLNKERTNES